MAARELLDVTKSLCPTCLRVIPAQRVADGDDVFLEKTCPDHGAVKAIIWRGPPSYQAWGPGIDAPGASKRQRESISGCPRDCGLCPQHKAETCTVLMEVTSQCNLNCPVCFASSNEAAAFHPGIDEIRAMLEAIIEAGGPYPLQLSGGEPTLREDLPDIVALTKRMRFNHVQINTHGLRLATDKEYLRRLKDAGADLIYLQFDGVTDPVYRRLRGANLFDLKVQAIDNCAEVKIGVQLVPTLIPGVNDHQIGDIVQFAKEHVPVVKGIHFQPISYFGRYPIAPSDDDRITTPDVLRALEMQTVGEVKAKHFVPRRRQDSHCGFSGFFVLEEDGRMTATTSFAPGESPTATCSDAAGSPLATDSPSEHVRRFITEKSRYVDPGQCACKQQSSLEGFFERAKTHFLSISGMPFQDAWTIDMERLQGCCVHVVTPQKHLVPFCAYYVTNAAGQRLSREA